MRPSTTTATNVAPASTSGQVPQRSRQPDWSELFRLLRNDPDRVIPWIQSLPPDSSLRKEKYVIVALTLIKGLVYLKRQRPSLAFEQLGVAADVLHLTGDNDIWRQMVFYTISMDPDALATASISAPPVTLTKSQSKGHERSAPSGQNPPQAAGTTAAASGSLSSTNAQPVVSSLPALTTDTITAPLFLIPLPIIAFMASLSTEILVKQKMLTEAVGRLSTYRHFLRSFPRVPQVKAAQMLAVGWRPDILAPIAAMADIRLGELLVQANNVQVARRAAYSGSPILSRIRLELEAGCLETAASLSRKELEVYDSPRQKQMAKSLIQWALDLSNGAQFQHLQPGSPSGKASPDQDNGSDPSHQPQRQLLRAVLLNQQAVAAMLAGSLLPCADLMFESLMCGGIRLSTPVKNANTMADILRYTESPLLNLISEVQREQQQLKQAIS